MLEYMMVETLVSPGRTWKFHGSEMLGSSVNCASGCSSEKPGGAALDAFCFFPIDRDWKNFLVRVLVVDCVESDVVD